MDRTNSKNFSLTGSFTNSNPKTLDMDTNAEIMEIILLGDKPAVELIPERVESNANLQVIELSDRKSKMALLRQLKLDSSSSVDLHGNECLQTNSTENFKKNMETYVLPPGTILIKQDNASNFQHETVNQRKPPKETAETTSSGNRTSGAVTENPKRVQRPIRNKKVVEVRRNPTRISKKNLDEDFVNPRQRLLSAKRKENFTNSEQPAKRVKLSSTPYMNTRSVTRKLYTVGATYQAPTTQDAMEWKEWPVHGMHERPSFHPQVGLGVEYIGRFFKCLDGRTYREIKVESEVEEISVDPHHQIADSQNLKKLNRKKIKKLDVQMNGETSDKENMTFETCMHTSLHSVLAYCAQVSNPRYHTNIQGRIETQKMKSCIKEINQESQKGPDLKNEIEFTNRIDKIATPIKIDTKKAKNITPIKNKEQTQPGEIEALFFNRSNSKVSNMVSRLEPKKFLITPRNSTNLTMNLQASHSKLQDVIRGSSKNALIIMKPQEPKRENTKPSAPPNDPFLKPAPSELNFELGKLDDPTISDETLMEMSSIYEKLVPVDEVKPNPENLSKSWQVENVDTELKNCIKQNETKGNDQNKNQTSEIAKILSEYIQNINMVPETQNCVLQNGLNNIKNAVKFNDQRKCEEKSKISQNLPKSREFATNKEYVTENKYIMKNKIDFKEVIDFSTVKSKEERTIKENDRSTNTESLQSLIENTAILYCAATGVRQGNLADYINNLDAEQSLGWLNDQNS